MSDTAEGQAVAPTPIVFSFNVVGSFVDLGIPESIPESLLLFVLEENIKQALTDHFKPNEDELVDRWVLRVHATAGRKELDDE